METPTATPAATTPDLASPTADPATGSAVESCVRTLGEAITDDTLVACIEGEGIEAAASVVAGSSDSILMATAGPDYCRTYNFMIWRADDTWTVQDLTPQLPSGWDYRLVVDGPRNGSAGGLEARLSGDGRLLAVTTVIAPCGSAPSGSVMLLVNEGDSWRVGWEGSRDAGRYNLSHTGPAFVGEGIDRVRIKGSSWFRDDPQREVFGEGNAGSHRWFVQTWVLRGEAYVLESEVVVPSAYNTLVEFMYALKTDDLLRAASLTTNDELIRTAGELGLVQGPDDRDWHAWCGDIVGAWAEPPCIVELPSELPFSERVRVDMVPDGDSWLISAIERSQHVFTSAYDALVQFMYVLKTGDMVTAASITTNVQLVDAAVELGLVQGLDDQEWYGTCLLDAASAGYLCTIELPSGDRVFVSVVPDGDSWLISEIEPEEPAS